MLFNSLLEFLRGAYFVQELLLIRFLHVSYRQFKYQSENNYKLQNELLLCSFMYILFCYTILFQFCLHENLKHEMNQTKTKQIKTRLSNFHTCWTSQLTFHCFMLLKRQVLVASPLCRSIRMMRL